jgi:hypothetical protein
VLGATRLAADYALADSLGEAPDATLVLPAGPAPDEGPEAAFG